MSRKTKRILLSCGISLTVIAVCFVTVEATRPSRFFNKYVLNPIPKSVRNIELDAQGWPSWNIFSYIWVMHFKVSKTDVELILGSRRFKEMSDVRYADGLLSLMEAPSSGEYLLLYLSGRRKPEWFRLEQWDNPKAYRFREMSISYQEHLQVLIYNEQLAEAYFIEHKGGHW